MNSSKKRTNEFVFLLLCDVFSFVFLEEIEDTKKTFRNYLTFKYIYKSHSRFYTKYVSEIESDSVGDYTRCRESLKDLGMTEVSDVDCSALRYVCECVSRRAGFMVSLFKPERV